MNSKERLLDISYRHKLSHLGSCLTALPIIEEIYAKKQPGDRFVLSAGHAHLAHLVVMEQQGLLNAEENLEKYGIHCDRQAGCDASTGSLGLGLPIAVGMALGQKDVDVYCLVTDGECMEGSIYEALEIAHKLNLHNLKIYVNMNGMSAYDFIDIPHLKKRLSAFNLDIQFRETDAHLGIWATGLAQHYKTADEELLKQERNDKS